MIIERLTPAELVVTDDEIRKHCRIEEQAWIEEGSIVRLYAESAQDEAERFTRRAIAKGTFRVTGVGEVLLYNLPITSVTSVTYGGSPVTHVRDDTGGIPKITFTGEATVEYLAGYGTNVPAPIKAWILMRTATMYDNRESDSSKPVQASPFVENLLMPYVVRLVLA